LVITLIVINAASLREDLMPALPPGRPSCPKVPGGRRPLPDPEAIRLCRIPDTAPPYDSEMPPGLSGEVRPDKARLDEAHPREAAAGLAGTAPGAGAGHRQAAPPGWPSRFAQALAETLAGSRPAEQMVPWTTQMARANIQRLGPRLASGQQPRVRRVIMFHPTSDVLEMSVVVGFGPRVRALAVRLERTGRPGTAGGLPAGGPAGGGGFGGGQANSGPAEGRWLCTAVEAA
jgi:hypothetical protein